MIRLLRWGFGVSALAAAIIAGLLGWNVWTYHRLTNEQWVADLQFRQAGGAHYIATLTRRNEVPRRFALAGDEWQLDVRLITWQPWMQMLGNDPVYRLDRISGRYHDVEQAGRTAPTVVALSENPGLDLWSMARKGGQWLPGVDAAYGSAVYLPMKDGASYRVTLSNKGLVARPLNDSARSAVSTWN